MIRPILALLLAAALASPTQAQVAAYDTLESVVVTATRAPVRAERAAAAVTTIGRAELEGQPATTLADAFALTPGFVSLGSDGAGMPPAVSVRGFYGGGEAEYVLLLVDGVPVNDAESGLVDWELVPLGQVERVEVLRGGASSLWGDAAIGAVVNVVTRGGADQAGAQASLSGGSYDTAFGSASARGTWRGRSVSAYGSLRRYGGFRDHAERTVGLVGASAELLRSERGTLRASLRYAATDADLPGPVAGRDGVRGSSPFYRFDGVRDRRVRAALVGTRSLGGAAEVSGRLVAGWRDADQTTTLPLSAEFGDTQRRTLGGERLEGGLQAVVGALGPHRPAALPIGVRLTMGATGAWHALDSRYAPVIAGTAADYAAARPDAGADPSASGDGGRLAVAAYAQAEAEPVAALRLVAGLRVDVLRDDYAASLPEQASDETVHTAWSPRVGANLRWLSTGRHVGHVYAQASRSFKAPTLDQLYDQRRIGVPFPPYSVALSSATLRPQRGAGGEIGLRHLVALSQRVRLEAQAALYRIDMEDEIDFSLQDFAYGNIGASRHDGLEVGLSARFGRQLRLHGSYAYTATTLRAGAFEGSYVKAIPRDVWSAGASLARGRLTASAVARGAARTWLDDANTIPLGAWTAVDARVDVRLRTSSPSVALTTEVFNLLDASYSTTGFPDAGGAETEAGAPLVYFYPAARRQLRLGLRLSI